MKKNKQILKAIVGIGALSLLCFAGNAKADVKQYFSNGNLHQYFELQTGANFGKNTFSASPKLDIAKTSINNNTANLNFGYGVNFQRKEDPTRAASFANGFSIGVNAGITAGGKFYNTRQVDKPVDSSDFYIDRKIGNALSYNLMLTAGFDVMKYKNYKVSLVGGAGLALNDWGYKIDAELTDSTGTVTSLKSRYYTNYTTFIAKAGVKQEFFVTKNISLGLELNYSYLGEYNAVISPETTPDKVSDIKTYYVKFAYDRNHIKLGGQFTTNFGIKYYL